MYTEKDSGLFVFPRSDEEHERDKRRIRNMYPEMAKRLAPYVEESCDRMEYEGGILYDECPDQLMMRRKTMQKMCSWISARYCFITRCICAAASAESSAAVGSSKRF